MDEIQLVTLDPKYDDALHNNPDYFSAMMEENWAKVADMVLQTIGTHLTETPCSIDELQWGGYIAVDSATREFVGSCCYKGEPNVHGTVEIAYFTYPAFEGRGYATLMARKLISLAAGSPLIKQIVAHTLPKENASTQVLKKASMSHVGEVVVPEDGKVWRWETDVQE